MERWEKQGEQDKKAADTQGQKFWVPLLLTASPVFILSIISAIGAWAFTSSQNTYYIFWFVAAGLWVIAIVIAILHRVKSKTRIAKAIGVGIGIAFISLAASCLANLFTVELNYL